MNKVLKYAGIFTLVLLLSAFSAHKFYVAIYQINYASDKKMLQVTSRVFVDDLNAALRKKYNVKTHVGEPEENSADIELMKKYFAENFSVKVNGKETPLNYLSKEMENNVLICYFYSRNIPNVSSIYIRNKILIDYVTEQQNIIQTSVNGKKGSLLLTTDEPSGTLNF